MGKTSNLTEKVKLSDLKKVGRGKPSLSLSNVDSAIRYGRIMKRMSRHYKVGEQTIYLLLLMCGEWWNGRNAVTLRKMCSLLYDCTDGASYKMMHEKKDVLVSRGLIEQCGLKDGKFMLFIPTLKAEKEIGYFTSYVDSVLVGSGPDASLIEGLSVAI